MKTDIKWFKERDNNAHYGSLSEGYRYCYGTPYRVEPTISDGCFTYKLLLEQYFSSLEDAKEWAAKLNDLIGDMLVERAKKPYSDKVVAVK